MIHTTTLSRMVGAVPWYTTLSNPVLLVLNAGSFIINRHFSSEASRCTLSLWLRWLKYRCMIGRPSNSKLKFKSGSSGYSIIMMTSFFSHFPLISTKRTLRVIESAEKDTISNESENSRPTKENPQNSTDSNSISATNKIWFRLILRIYKSKINIKLLFWAIMNLI